MKLGFQIGVLAAKAVALAFGTFLVNDLLVMINIGISPSVPWSIAVTIYLAVLVATTIGKRWQSYPIVRPNVASVAVFAYVLVAIILSLFVLIIQGSLGGLKLAPHPVPGQASRLLSAVVVIFIPQISAFYEELAFRGVLQGGVHSIIGSRVAVLISTLLFCVLHAINAGFAQSWLALLVMSATCGLIAARTGCLWPGMLIHAGYNLAITTPAFIWGGLHLGALKTIVIVPIVGAILLMAIATVTFKLVPHRQVPSAQ